MFCNFPPLSFSHFICCLYEGFACLTLFQNLTWWSLWTVCTNSCITTYLITRRGAIINRQLNCNLLSDVHDPHLDLVSEKDMDSYGKSMDFEYSSTRPLIIFFACFSYHLSKDILPREAMAKGKWSIPPLVSIAIYWPKSNSYSFPKYKNFSPFINFLVWGLYFLTLSKRFSIQSFLLLTKALIANSGIR